MKKLWFGMMFAFLLLIGIASAFVNINPMQTCNENVTNCQLFADNNITSSAYIDVVNRATLELNFTFPNNQHLSDTFFKFRSTSEDTATGEISCFNKLGSYSSLYSFNGDFYNNYTTEGSPSPWIIGIYSIPRNCILEDNSISVLYNFSSSQGLNLYNAFIDYNYYNFSSIYNSCFGNATLCEYGSDLLFVTPVYRSGYAQFNYTYNFSVPDGYRIINISANTTIGTGDNSNITIYCNTTALTSFQGDVGSYSTWNGTDWVLFGYGANLSYNILQSCVENNKINMMFELNEYGDSVYVHDTQFFYSLEEIPEEPEEEQLSYLDTSTYKVMEGSGAGFALFIDYIVQPLFYLLVLIVLVALIGVIGYALAGVIRKAIAP